MAEQRPDISENYSARLLTLAEGEIGGPNNSNLTGEDLLAQLHDRRFAASTMQPGETIPYVRVGSTTERPVLYVPGFTEGIEAKAPFALELAKHGQEIILPGQNRTEILKDATTNKSDATYTQAQNYLDVLRAEGLANKPGSVNIITHSYGSLIFDAMHKIATDENLPCFEGAKVALLAPAGTNTKERLPKLAGRFAYSMAAENFTHKDFPDDSGEMLKAGIANGLANLPRSIREGFEMGKRRVNYERLLYSELGKITVMDYAKDAVFPARVLHRAITNAFNLENPTVAMSWSTPISLQPQKDDASKIRSGLDASHNDEQFNPSRAASAVAHFLTH